MRYIDCFRVKVDYAPCMTKEAINRNPRTWLQFYPHKTFVSLLRTLLDKLNGGNQSVWLTGPYGTGKSHAALVLQKLFMDDESRVDEWLEDRKALIPTDVARLLKQIRRNKVLAVFDSGTDNVDSPKILLVRIERAIQNALVEAGYKIPLMGQLDQMIVRVRREGTHFLATRNGMQQKLCYLTSDIRDIDEWEKRIRDPALTPGLVSDTMRVLAADNIYLNPSPEDLVKWVNAVLDANGISKLVFIWDEFSTYVQKHAAELKTLESIAEASQEGRFFLIPVTHMQISSYLADGSDSAKKANDRFSFVQLDLPTNTALLLGADAFEVLKGSEWNKERDVLWHCVKGLVENYMIPKKCEALAEDFKGMLPIHPMAAFVLKHLSTAVGSNQRSMFNYLKGNSGSSEFQNFIAVGGPDIRGRQFLTVDYLWSYFIERSDLGLDRDVLTTRTEYDRKSSSIGEDGKRVLKAVLLYSLLGRRTHGAGHELLQPTRENIVRSFEGDGAIVDVDRILLDLEHQHCFSIVNDRCEMFRSSIGGEELAKKMKDAEREFGNLILTDKTLPKLESRIRGFKDKARLDVQLSTVDKCMASAIKNMNRYRPDDGNRLLVYFVLAQDAQEQRLISDKLKQISAQFNDRRVLFVMMPELTFCDGNADRWQEYIEQWAHRELANDQGSRGLHQNQLDLMSEEWVSQVLSPNQKLRVYKPNPNGQSFVTELEWSQFEVFEQTFLKEAIEFFVDEFGGYNITAMGQPQSLRNWAKAGIMGIEFLSPGAWKTVINKFASNGISFEPAWFDDNPAHPLTQIRDKCKKWLDNTVGKGAECSLRKLYLELQRPPYGLICVPYTAFVLGFVLKEWLTSTRQLQWTDGTISQKLDLDSLAGIIEDVVLDDGRNQIKGEKVICRLSKEEKAFIEKGIVIFRLQASQNSTVENTLQEIAGRLEKVSGRAPLWVLNDYIRFKSETYADELCNIIDWLCQAISISSKRNTDEKSKLVKDIGDLLLRTEGLTETIASYINPEVFAAAFKQYVDTAKPELSDLAIAVGDRLDQYCQVLKDQCASTAGWLWTKQNVEAEIDKVFLKYRLIQWVQNLMGQSGYLTFDTAIDRLKRAMFAENKISMELIDGCYPGLSRLSQIVNGPAIGDVLSELDTIITLQNELVKKLYFDPSQREQLNILKNIFENMLADQCDSDLRALYASLSEGAGRTESDFKAQAVTEIREFFKNSMARQIARIWKENTGSESPRLYSSQHGIPAAILLEDDFVNHINVISDPSAFTHERLKETKKALESGAIVAAANDSGAAKKRFVTRALPIRYQKLGIDPDDLSSALKFELGEDPNNWLQSSSFSEAVEKIVQERYQSTYKERAMEKVRSLSPEAAKQRLLKVVELHPDAGLDLLE